MKTIKLTLVILAVLFATTAMAANLTTTVWDQKVIDPGYTLADTTTVQTMLTLGWLDVNYMHAAGSSEPFEIDAEISHNLYKDNGYKLNIYAGLFALNGEKFSTARELGLTTSYTAWNNLTANVYVAKIWGQFSEGGHFAKLFVTDKYSYGNLSCGWKMLLAYNGNYFLNDSGWSHRQLQAWVSYPITDYLKLKLDAGTQYGMMDQFQNAEWYGLSVGYDFDL
jgi:hypothetical protein